MICIFTICAKNYLAQALTLKTSCLKYNPDIDFFIFLSDAKEGEQMPEVIELDDCWIQNWRSLAFKYNVIEFSTSVKPFCIKKLFKDGYEKVIYLDPDICIYDSLDYIWDKLNDFSVVLTPHRCEMQLSWFSPFPDSLLSNVGIYNLGFLGIKNDYIGNTIIDWWCCRLSDYCYIEFNNGLFVDQKWMDFVPGYFPNHTYISHHLGLNASTWNLCEREIINRDGKYYVKGKESSNEYPLVFFHYSGFSPSVPNRIDKRRESMDIVNYPTLKPLLDEYCKEEIKNNYDYYSKLKYKYNYFEDGTEIIPQNRKMYKSNTTWHSLENPFSAESCMYEFFLQNLLLSQKRALSVATLKPYINQTINRMRPGVKTIVKLCALATIKIIGIERLKRFVNLLRNYSMENYNSDLI